MEIFNEFLYKVLEISILLSRTSCGVTHALTGSGSNLGRAGIRLAGDLNLTIYSKAYLKSGP